MVDREGVNNPIRRYNGNTDIFILIGHVKYQVYEEPNGSQDEKSRHTQFHLPSEVVMKRKNRFNRRKEKRPYPSQYMNAA